MKNDNYVVRHMSKKELETAIDWAAKEGWNPGLHDADCFYKADPKGFFIGLLNGEPAGSISAVSYDPSFGFIGFYIVKPEFRNKGYGIKLWNAALGYLGDRNIGLDGVPEQQENYKKAGFQLAYRNIRYQGVGTGTRLIGPRTVRRSDVAFEQVNSYDESIFPAGRKQFIRCWVSQPQSAAFSILRDGRLSGYGVLRTCRNGFKIGPLFADDHSLAEELLESLIGSVPKDNPFFLDIPEVNPHAVALVQKTCMQKVFETARMYNKKIPQIPIERVFGVTSFELG